MGGSHHQRDHTATSKAYDLSIDTCNAGLETAIQNTSLLTGNDLRSCIMILQHGFWEAGGAFAFASVSLVEAGLRRRYDTLIAVSILQRLLFESAYG